MYRWVDHTGELELEINAPDERTVFADALDALHELAEADPTREPTGTAGPAGSSARDLELSASDRATLLVEFLEELVFYSETEDFVPDRLHHLELSDGMLRATVEGHVGRPPHLVKAVTYHRLAFERSGEGWRAQVVFDV
jgi:SHS2 domain-containing protein